MTSTASAANAPGLLLAEAEAASARQDYRHGDVLARQALEIALACGDAALVTQAQSMLARLGAAMGDFESAARHGEQALAYAVRHGPPTLLASICNALSFAYERAGLHALAVDHGLQALETARDCGDRAAECLALNRLGYAVRGSDESARGIGLLEESVRLGRTLPEPDAAFWPLNNLTSRWIEEADRLANFGRDVRAALAAAQQCAHDAESIAQASGKKFQQAMINGNLAGIHRRRGEYDLARARFSSAIALMRAADAERHEATFRLALTSLEVEAAPTVAGCTALEQALETYAGADAYLPSRSRRVLANAWRRLGDSERAFMHLERVLTETLADAGRRADLQSRLLSSRAELVRERNRGDLARLELEVQRTRAEAEERLAHELAAHRDRLEAEVAARTSELQCALTAAEAASRAKTAFLAIVGHELRTPLNGVIGMIELVRLRTSDQRQVTQLEKSLRAARELSGLVDRLLEFVADSPASAVVDTDLRVLIEDVLSAARAQAQVKGLELKSDVAADLPVRVRVDAQILQRVLDTLLDNAVKFSTQGTVRIRARWQAGEQRACRLILSVVDEGSGMPPDLVERLFRPFEMGDTSATRVHGGLGVGLALVLRWVQSLGGEVTVESVLHQGSTFRVSLPVLATDAG